MNHYYSYLNNKQLQSDDSIVINSPEDQQAVGTIWLTNKAQLREVFQAASCAFKSFRHSSFALRKAILIDWRKKIAEHSEYIISLIVSCIAKTPIEAAKEVKDALSFIDEIVSFAYFKQPRFYDCNKSGIKKIAYYERLPHGVILCINPFNYPVSSCMFKVAPALITGNTVVFKSATQTSIIVSYLFRLLAETQIHPGVASFVACRGSEIGDDLVNNHAISVINFTGSTKVGLRIQKNNHWSKLLLELGGNDVGIVLADCNLPNAITEIIAGCFRYNGQRCTAIKRLIVEDSIHDKCVGLLKTAVNKLTVGRASDNNYITSLIDDSARERVQALIAKAVDEGGIVECGNRFEHNLCYPTIVSNANPTMKLFASEQFGPVLPIYRIADGEINKVIKIANDSEFGLQGSIFTQDIDKAFYLAKRIETGTININCSPAKGPNYLPFFGIKQSGQGSQGYEDILNLYTYQKGVIIKHI